jgi:hypothetical protein
MEVRLDPCLSPLPFQSDRPGSSENSKILQMANKLKWREVQTSVLEKALSTGHAHKLSCEEMPTWAQDSHVVTEAWLYAESCKLIESTGALSTEHVHGHLFVERQHPESPNFRYDQYLLVQIVDGRVFQHGPHKDIEFGHHHDERPSWLTELLSRSTG